MLIAIPDPSREERIGERTSSPSFHFSRISFYTSVSIILLLDRVSQVSRVLPLVLQSQLLQQRDTDLHYDLVRHVGRRGSLESLVE